MEFEDSIGLELLLKILFGSPVLAKVGNETVTLSLRVENADTSISQISVVPYIFETSKTFVTATYVKLE